MQLETPHPEDEVEALSSEVPPAPILFFDGHCNLCNGFVSLVLRLDAGSDPVRVKLSSLQSPEAHAVLSTRGLRPEAFVSPDNARDETVVFIDHSGRMHLRSAAVPPCCCSQVSGIERWLRECPRVCHRTIH